MQRRSLPLVLFFTACHSHSVTPANSPVAGLPGDAMIIETQPLPVPDRSLVLWMVHPTRHEDTIVDGVYTCPDQTTGHYFEGPARASLIDTAGNKVIKTLTLRFDWGEQDTFSVPYRIEPYFYHVPQSSDGGEGKPRILSLKDFTGTGEATQFALFDAQNCSVVATSIYGFSHQRDSLVQYPFDLTFLSRGKVEHETRHWLDHFATEKPLSPGYWKYSLDYNSGERSTYEIRFDPAREAFVGTVTSVPIP
jgi:hypothetical protein